jgi:hypothetical protein
MLLPFLSPIGNNKNDQPDYTADYQPLPDLRGSPKSQPPFSVPRGNPPSMSFAQSSFWCVIGNSIGIKSPREFTNPRRFFILPFIAWYLFHSAFFLKLLLLLFLLLRLSGRK